MQLAGGNLVNRERDKAREQTKVCLKVGRLSQIAASNLDWEMSGHNLIEIPINLQVVGTY